MQLQLGLVIGYCYLWIFFLMMGKRKAVLVSHDVFVGICSVWVGGGVGSAQCHLNGW